jgi:hypothetical protein
MKEKTSILQLSKVSKSNFVVCMKERGETVESQIVIELGGGRVRHGVSVGDEQSRCSEVDTSRHTPFSAGGERECESPTGIAVLGRSRLLILGHCNQD